MSESNRTSDISHSSPLDSKQAAQSVNGEKTLNKRKQSNTKPFFRKRNVKQNPAKIENKVTLKLLKPRLTGQYNLIKNVPCIIRPFVGGVKLIIRPKFELMRETLGVYFSNHVDFDFNKLRLLKSELGLHGDFKRTDVISSLSNRYIEWTASLAKYFVQKVTEHKHLVLHDLLGDVPLPIMFVRFVSLYRNINRVRQIPNTTNHIYTELDKIEFPDSVITDKSKQEQNIRPILEINDPIKFKEYLDTIININKILGTDYNINFNLEKHQTALDCLLSCIITEDKTITIRHSEQLPTEKDICDTFMYGISYEMTDIPNNYIGDLKYELPEGYERYLATRFWDLTMNSTDVTITTTVEKYGTFEREGSESVLGVQKVQVVDQND